MLDAVRTYATRIVLLHLALLILVVSFVLGGVRQVQSSARDEAQEKAKDRLQLVADPTARGIESHYLSILSDLEVILRDESHTAATAPASMPTTEPVAQTSPAATAPASAGGQRGFGRGILAGAIGGNNRPGRGGGGGGGGGGGLGGGGRGQGVRLNPTDPVTANENNLNTLWRQLRGRVSQLFLVNTQTQNVRVAFPLDNPDSAAAASKIAKANADWLKSIKDAQMSSFQFADGLALGEHAGYHLIAMPATLIGAGPGGGPGSPGGPPNGPNGPNGPGPLGLLPQFAVVAVVPVDNVREQFLDPINQQPDREVNVLLVNEAGQVLVANHLAPGSNLLDQMDPDTAEKFKPLVISDNPHPLVLETPFTVAGRTIQPQIFAASQLEVPSGRHWSVIISSPVSDSDAVVNRLFRSALAWALFVALAIAAILFSTSVFLIGSRVRLERTRHEVLTRELEQARHIQLAWLPDLKSVPAGIDISAVNLPASHISGDFYNWFPLPVPTTSTDPAPSSKIAIIIGDVTGHGMAAAFLMATTQLLVRMTLSRYQDVGRCLREVNKQLCMQAVGGTGGFQGQFVTMLVMVLDTHSNEVQIASAGHPTPLVETRDGAFRSLEIEPQLVLGVNPDEDYHSQHVTLDPGATVLLYTDGVVEAERRDGAQYGVDNLVALMQKQAAADPTLRIRAILDDVKRFSNNHELMDDLTLVALRTSPIAINDLPTPSISSAESRL